MGLVAKGKIMKLRENENVLHELHPKNRILTVWFFTKVLGWSVMGGLSVFWLIGMTITVAGGIGDVDAKETMNTMGFWSALVFVASFVLSCLYAYLLRGTFKYFVTNQRCIFVGGILRYRKRSIPYHKVTDVELSRNILEQLLGISSIRIFTPGTSSSFSFGMLGGGQRPELNFEGLENADEAAESINVLVRDSKDAVHT